MGLWALALPLPSGPRPWAGKASYRPVSSVVHNYEFTILCEILLSYEDNGS